MNSFLTVVRFTLRNRLRSKPFLISSLIFVLIISVGINLPKIIDTFSSNKATKVGMVDDAGHLAQTLKDTFAKQDKPSFEIMLYPSTGKADSDEQLLAAKRTAGEVKSYLLLEQSPDKGTFPKAVYKSGGILGGGKKAELQQALLNVKTQMASANAGLSPAQMQLLFAPVALDSLQLDAQGGVQAGKTEDQRNAAYALTYVLLFLTFMIVTMYGNLIATEVTAEKSSRVMELLITSVSPLKQMFGKITGMFLLGLIQILLFVVTGLANIKAGGNMDALKKAGLDLNRIDPSLLVYFGLFFILAFFLYATLLAGVGSLVSRTEDLGQAIMPVTLVSLASFYISIYGLNNPTAPFVTAMSYVPFFTPMLMFLRVGMTTVPVWQVLLGVADLLVGILLLGWFAAKLYRVGVLMYGKRPSLREVIRAMRASRV